MITVFIALAIVVSGGFMAYRCNQMEIEKMESLYREQQKQKKEKAKKEAQAVRAKDFKRIEKLNQSELSSEEKHKLLQEIGTR